MEATELSPTPSSATTVPRPKVSCWTRSPGSRDGIGRPALAFLAASERALAVPKRFWGARPPLVGMEYCGRFQDVIAPAVRRQSTRSAGSSSRNREAGLCEGAPHAERTTARET